MSKFKVGDRVRIKPECELKDISNNFNKDSPTYIYDMVKYCSTYVTISDCYCDTKYHIEEDGGIFGYIEDVFDYDDFILERKLNEL